MIPNTPIKEKSLLTIRGIVDTQSIIDASRSGNRNKLYKAISEQRSGFLFSYTRPHYQLHIVDRFALYPLFYLIDNGQPHVSQVVDDLVPLLERKRLHPEGYYGTGGLGKGGRSTYTPFDGILRIPPGHFLEYRDNRYEVVQYWSFQDLRDSPFEGSYEEACDTLGALIKQSVERCYYHSQNLAVHLSGGIDSGSITALLAQSKKDHIHAYAHVKEDAPDDHPIYENGYLRKYEQHYPNIATCKSHTLGFDPDLAQPIHSAGNWHMVQYDNPEIRICQDLASKQIPYILSGVGGDELASYGHGHQNSKRTISGDAQARQFMYRQMHLRRKCSFLAKGILGRSGPRMDSIASSLLIQPFTEKHKNYNASFRSQVKDLKEGNLISLYWFPSSYEYRLTTLQKSHFTVRSDIWNFLSRSYGIDYMFPLMDTDLVEFCARIPRAFFIGRPQRDMIKKGLKKYLSEDLLTGGKRPGYQPPATGAAPTGQPDTNDLLREYRTKIAETKGSLAASVYDLAYMDQKMRQYQTYLGKIPHNWVQTKKAIQQKARMMKVYFNHMDYVNAHFDDLV